MPLLGSDRREEPVYPEVSLKGLLGDDRKPVYPADDPIDEHGHKWKAVGMTPITPHVGVPVSIIQSCKCGEIRRVEVP